MKKYLNIFVAVLLSALTFSLTSCGDDDEPIGNNSSGNNGSYVELKINGKNYIFDILIPNLGDDSYSCGLLSNSSEGGLEIVIKGDLSKLKNGYTFNKNDDSEPYISIVWFDEKKANIGAIIEGNIRVENFDSNNIKLSFNKVTFSDYGVYSSDEFTIEGIANLPLEDVIM